MSRFTPGPWRVVGGLWGTSEGWPIAQVGDGLKIASQPMHSDSIGAGAADAKLIAAAPEMFDTLKSVLQRVHQAYHEGEPSDCRKGVCADIHAMLARAGS